jgi:MFS family permease
MCARLSNEWLCLCMKVESKADGPETFQAPVSPKVARQIVFALVFPTVLMPFMNSVFRVALPPIRDYFELEADMAAWVVTAFLLPFVILSTVYGRLSDGLGQRTLILIGSVLFVLGSTVAMLSPGLGWLIVGRAIQGLGTGGMFPMAMALIALVYDPRQRGGVLGAWSTTGPTTAFIAPAVCGVLIERWGWRASLAPALLLGTLAFVSVLIYIPRGLGEDDTPGARAAFLRSFDWLGMGLLAAFITVFLFYLSSRPITGKAPLLDWRLLAGALVLGALYVWREGRRAWWQTRGRAPFMDLGLFGQRQFTLASACASLRLFAMNGIGLLIPLYLADVRDLSPALLGVMVTVSPGAMIVMVFLGGRISDLWGSRMPAAIGVGMQAVVAILLCLLAPTAPLWGVVLVLALYGLGNGFALASLHHAALSHIPEAQIGQASGLYSMLRFFGSVVGSALAGVVLAFFLDRGLPALQAYRYGFLVFGGVALAGALVGTQLEGERADRAALKPANSDARVP